jgi:hypothetical protein
MGMKVIMWSALCGVAILAGHVILGGVALLLLLGCVPVRDGNDRQRAVRKSHAELV